MIHYREPLPGERVGKADLPGWLLTPAQAQGIAMQQELCHQLIDLLAKMNENAVVYELPLPPMATVAAAERLLQVDDVVKKCRFAAAKLGIEPVRGYQAKVAETIGAENMPIVLDEAQFALHDAAACLEVLRGITDKSGTILVAVTMDHEVPRFNRREQIGSRFFRKCQFHESTLGDVGAACQQLAEGVRIGDDLVERIHRETGGRMRLVLNAISRVEQIAHHLKAESLAAEAVASIALCEDFQRAGVRRRAGA